MNATHTIAIGIDVGGTFIKAGLVNKSGRILSFHKHKTPTDDDGQQLVSMIAQLIRNLEKEFTQLPEPHALACADKNPSEPQSSACEDNESQQHYDYNTPIAIALPGPLDPQRNAILRSVNLPFLQGTLIADDMFREIGRRPLLFTDAEAATWGEYAVQKPAPARFAHLRLGTGVACGVVIDDKFQSLNRNDNQHASDLVVDHTDDAIPCPCGLRGCLETVASGIAIEQFARNQNIDNGLAGMQKHWEKSDTGVRDKLVCVAQAIHVACNNLIERYQPDVIVIGGGVIDHLPGLYSMILSCAHTGSASNVPKNTAIVPARLSDYAGVTGAALLALQSQ